MKTVKPAHGTAALFLNVNGTTYRLRFIESHEEIGRPAWKLTKLDKDGATTDTAYEILLTPHGPNCNCPDFVYRRDGRDPGLCKHCRSLVAVGLLKREAT